MNNISDGVIYLKQDLFDNKREANGTPFKHFFIHLCDTDEIVGRIDLRIGDITNKDINMIGNIGIDINELYQHKEYGTRAVALVESIALENNMNDIYMSFDPSNEASRRICEKIGYEYVDTSLVEKGTIAYLKGYRERALYKKVLKETRKAKKH